MPIEPKSYARRIPPTTWEKHRCRIKGLFVDQKRTLSQVVEIMKHYGLHASESQYERQLKIWGIRKNRTRDEWCLIKRVVEERRRQGKDSTVLIDGVVQPSERLEREFARSGYGSYGGLEPNLPKNIQVMSPSAAASSPDNSPGLSNSEDGVFRATQTDSSLSNLNITLVKEYAAAKTHFLLEAKKVMNRLLTMACKLGLRKTLASVLQNWEFSPGSSNFRDCVESYLKDLNILHLDYEPDCSSNPITTPPSPSGSWSLPSVESVGITSEEWVTRGWNVFFGAWGVG